MELHDFLEKFLPNYDAIAEQHDLEDKDDYLYFLKHHFSEALANYTDLICNEQRKLCYKNFMVGDIPFKTAIIDTPQPKISNL